MNSFISTNLVPNKTCLINIQMMMRKAVAAWANRRIAPNHTIDGQFSSKDDRIKLRHLYLVFSS